MSNWEGYFGHPDASQDSPADVASVHTSRDFERAGRLKSHKQEDGKCIVVGIKGSGKTALRKMLENDKDALIWSLDAQHSYLSVDPDVIRGKSGHVMNVIAFHLLREFAEQVESRRKTGKLGTVIKAIRSAGSAGVEMLRKIPDAVKVEAPGVEVDLAALLKPASVKIVQSAWRSTCAAVTKALDGQRAYILIDDAEEVFAGMESNAEYVEGVAKTVVEINAVSKQNLHVLLFLKQGIWRYWFENQGDYDKLKKKIQFISWRGWEELAEMVARRIARIHNATFRPSDIEALWRRDFEWSGEFSDFVESIAYFCVNGPRDMIDLLNSAKERARERRITKRDVDEAAKGFSEEKLFGLGADFRDVYKDVEKMVELVLRDAPAGQSGKDFADLIEEKLIRNKDDPTFVELNKHRWYQLTTKERLLQILYQVGVIGILSNGHAVYAIESPNEQGLREGFLIVHPAFRPYLGISNGNEKEAPVAPPKGSKKRF